MKQLLITIAALVLVGCGESQQSNPVDESKPVDPGTEVRAKPPSPVKSQPAEPVTEAKAPEISIHEAAFNGDIEAVKQHLAAGTDVNTKDDGWTPLHLAAYRDKKIAELLIAEGADVNAKDEDETTPLHYAAHRDRKEIAELLIAKGADVNAKDEDGVTPQHLAAELGHKEIVELLIAEGADVNAKVVAADVKAETPLNFAIEENYTETADLLRKHGDKTGKELKAEGK